VTRAPALALAVVVGVLVAACRPTAPPVTPAHEQWARAQWPSTTHAELERGRSLFLSRCSACHLPPSPSDHTPGEWPGEIAEMRDRAHLGADEVLLIERYVVTVASTR